MLISSSILSWLRNLALSCSLPLMNDRISFITFSYDVKANLLISIFRLKFFASVGVFKSMPEPDIVPRIMGFIVKTPATVPVATNLTDAMLLARSNFLIFVSLFV